jgi:hypothetical protein
VPGIAPAIVDEALRIIEESERRGLTLRAFGGIAYYLHSQNQSLFAELGREGVQDLDLVGLGQQRNDYKRMFEDLDYAIDWDRLVSAEGRRFLFQHAGEPPLDVDLFIDRLDMCHTLELRERLAIQGPTLSLADLLLQKLQIVDLNRKDVVDVVVLLSDHDLDGESSETVDIEYIASLLADDWGFYYTVNQNLGRLKDFVATAPVAEALRTTLESKLDRLEAEIEAAPKSRRWKLRAKIGARKKWYQDVEEGTDAF